MNFYDVLAAEKWGGGVPTTNFFDLLLAQSISGGQWETYEGTIPATFNANGDDMRQYQIYGSTGGVGDDSGTAYGYKLDISTSDGTTSTVTPIYIGYDPLEKDEYVDYQAGKIYRYETEIKKDVSQTGWQWDWEAGTDVTSQTTADNRVSVGRFYPEDAKEYIITAVPNTFQIAVISADESNIKIADTGWGESWTLSGASAHSFCVTVRKSDNSDITPSEVDGVKFKVTSLTPTDPPVPLPALPTCDGETIVDYAGSGAAPEKVYFEYKGGTQT